MRNRSLLSKGSRSISTVSKTAVKSIPFSKLLSLFSLALFLLILLVQASTLGAQTINAKQRDVIIIDNGASGKADPNDRIRYDVTIENTGGPAGTNTQLNIVPDPRTTLVPGSYRSSPLALDDAYPSTGNVGITVPAATGLRANDFDDDIANALITAGTFTTTGGGSIVIAADGSFTYNPPVGLTGGSTDSYTYTLNDGNPVGGTIPTTNTATVTFTLTNIIWFIDNTGGGSGGTGTLADPFKQISNFNAASGPTFNQLIFIKHTGTNYVGPLNLKTGQIVFGSGHTGGANLSNVLPFSLAANSNTLPAINGSRPIITNNIGDGIYVAADNTLRGIDLGNVGGFAIRNTGTTSVGNLTISEVSISNGLGGGFNASNGGGTLNVVFTSLTTAGGFSGVILVSTGGTFTINGGSINTSGNNGVLIQNGTVTFSTSGNVTNSASGFAVDIDNHDSNNITFSGNITSTVLGIRVQNCGGGTITFSGASKSLNTGANAAVTLASNTGATITFSGGGLVITTTSGVGFNATGGATAVNVTGTGNTISSAGGAALNVVSTTIGGSDLNFQSISANGGTNGIVLNTTGSSGGLTISGDVGSSNNFSGGTIQSTTGDGIFLSSTQDVNIDQIRILSTGGSGINGVTVTNFSLTNSTINNAGNAGFESAVSFNGNGTQFGTSISGTLTLTGNAISTPFYSGLDIQADNGTVSNATCSNNTISNPGFSGLNFVGTGNSSTCFNLTKATVANNSITGTGGNGIQFSIGNSNTTGPGATAGVVGSGINIISVTGNSITVDPTGTQAITMANSGGNPSNRTQTNFDISSNGTTTPLGSSALGTVILIGNNGYSTMTGTCNNNVIVATHTPGGGGGNGIGGGNGVAGAGNLWTPDMTLTCNGNNLSGIDGNDILLVGRGTSGTAKFTIKNNICATPVNAGGSARPGIRVDAGNASSFDDAVCVDIQTNTSGGSNGAPGIGIRKQGTVATTNDFGIEGFAGGTCSQAEDYIATVNPGSVIGTSGCGGMKRCISFNGDNYGTCSSAP